MKALVKFVFITAGICLLMTCAKTDEFLNNNQDDNALKSTTKKVTVPFKANFSVWDHSDYTDNSCGGDPVFFLTMEGFGPATHLGKMTTTITFCCNIITGYYNIGCILDLCTKEIPVSTRTAPGSPVPFTHKNLR